MSKVTISAMVPSLQQPRRVSCQPLSLPAGLRPGRTEEVKVGLRLFPYLADHAFQNMIVLPGSFCLEAALRLHAGIAGAAILQNIEFHRPVILGDEELTIKIHVREIDSGRLEYVFSETANESCFARLEIVDAKPNETETPRFSVEEARSGLFIEGKKFYDALRQNQYGPQFQNLSSIWRSGDRAWGQLAVLCDDAGDSGVDVRLLDSITQLLAASVIERNQAFALKSIESLQVRSTNFPKTLWARARLDAGAIVNATGFRGDIEVFDESGNCYLEFRGVAFSYLAAVDAPETLKLCLAASFTAEPVEDSLKFWADRFGLSAEVQFAPYHQIFQQLLDKDSALRRHENGINIILLNLEDWVTRDEPASLKANRQKLENSNRARCVLPNGLEIVHLNQYETDYLYQEIFRDECYLRHGIRINDGDTIVDIGANIGLFSLFVLNRCPRARIYAFEPSPVVFELLKANCEAYGQEVYTFQCGVSDQPKSADFTFYDRSSVFSGFHSNALEDKAAIEAVVRNILRREVASSETLAEELTAERLHRQTYSCRLTSLSEIIRQNKIERIHLLKIDAEKSELDIIRGIEDAHWPLIDQLVIEVHDRTGEAAKQIEQLLTGKGYNCAIEQEKLLENSGLFNIYATRLEKREASVATPLHRVRRSLKINSDEFRAALGSFVADCQSPVLLCFCPPSPETPELNQILAGAEQELSEVIDKMSNVRGISSRVIVNRCQSQDCYDSYSSRLGHVPFTPEGYAAIGTTLFENVFRLRSKPVKVLVLDCDGTLWQGVCGEDGPLGVTVTKGHRALQEFVVKQMEAGLVVCLCSKNNEKDVFDVFAQNHDMVLKREHFAAWQINWADKSDNLETLATRLNLGLDSFLYIDDNPVECAEVKIRCSDVLTLQLPGKSEEIPQFLDGIWPLRGNSSTSSTREDRERTLMYQRNTEREQLRDQGFTLKDFLAGLQLRIEVTASTDEQIGRISQLSWRTNQFNFTTIRRSEEEVRKWLASKNRNCLVTTVSDRFGDYGLVGVLLYETGADQFTVDTFLLSCRALGRGVEHRMLAELGRVAAREGKALVHLQYLPTEKNTPALEFIRTLRGGYVENDAGALSVTLSAKELSCLEYQPVEKTRSREQRRLAEPAARSAKAFESFDRSTTFQEICGELTSIGAITKAVENFAARDKDLAVSAEIGPGETLEKTLVSLWRRVLGRGQIGLNENFFEAGGTSLKAVQLIALIQRELKRSLPITALFECPTIGSLAAKMNSPTRVENSIDAVKALKRGQQRRNGRNTKRVFPQ